MLDPDPESMIPDPERRKMYPRLVPKHKTLSRIHIAKVQAQLSELLTKQDKKEISCLEGLFLDIASSSKRPKKNFIQYF
jgi:hypothetical protein